MQSEASSNQNEKVKNFGFSYPTESSDPVELTDVMINFGMSKIGRAIDSCQMAYLKFEMRNKYK